MSLSHTLIRGFSRAGESLAASLTVSADAENNLDPVIPTGDPTPVADYEINWAVDVSAVKSLYMLCDQTIHLNVNTGGGQAIDLVAGQALEWAASDGTTCPLGAADVTKLLADNANLAVANLKIRCLVDSTPV